jgi:trigger factor
MKKAVEIAFAEDNEGVEAGMRGKTMSYAVAMKKIEEQHLLPLDEEFAKKVSDGKIETLEALRADIRKDLLRAERQKARTEVGNEVVAALSEGATLDLPAVMIDKQVDSDVENMRNHLGQDHNQTLEAHLRAEEKTLEELREELRPEATRRLRNSLVLREIATREGVSVSPQDIDAEIDRMVGAMENGVQMRQFYSSNYIRTMLESELFERKLMDRVIDIATEGRGAADPPEEPERTEDGSTIIEAEAVENESGGVLPADRSIAIDEAEAVAASETVVPKVDEQAAKEPERA